MKELESKIYETFYNLNPDGDARYELWPAVAKAKTVQELEIILDSVQNGDY